MYPHDYEKKIAICKLSRKVHFIVFSSLNVYQTCQIPVGRALNMACKT